MVIALRVVASGELNRCSKSEILGLGNAAHKARFSISARYFASVESLARRLRLSSNFPIFFRSVSGTIKQM